MNKFYNTTSIVFITAAVDSANQGTAIVEVGGEKRSVKLNSDYSIEYNGVKVSRTDLSIETTRRRQLSEIVLAVQICLLIKEAI